MKQAQLDQIEATIIERVEDELIAINTEELYNDMLDELYSFQSVGGCFSCMEPHRVLFEIDPVAYRCGKNDYEDSLREDYEEINDNYYDKQAVKDIREEVEDEMKEEFE